MVAESSAFVKANFTRSCLEILKRYHYATQPCNLQHDIVLSLAI